MPGEKVGRTIGFPTVNLDPSIISNDTKLGVYAADVYFKKCYYNATLYFGPRLVKGEKHNVLELYIHNFDREIYGETILFALGEYIRGVMTFDTLEELKEQIADDIDKTKTRHYNKVDPPEIEDGAL